MIIVNSARIYENLLYINFAKKNKLFVQLMQCPIT